MTATINRISGKIQRVTITRISGKESEAGKEYYNLDAYTRSAGIWENIGTVVAFAATRAECREIGVSLGLGEVPMLGSPECTLDGQVRGSAHALASTGICD